MTGKSDVTMEVIETPEAKSLNPNDVEMTESKTKKSTFHYLLELLSDSVVTGVPQIITAGNLLRKIFKILVLGACIGGFIYQAVEFMKLYKTYPSSLDIEMNYTEDLPDPAVTICNRNPVKRREYCNAKKDLCSKPTNRTLFCNMYPHHCNENTTLDDLEFVISDGLIEKADVEKYGHGKEIIDECCSGFFPLAEQCRARSKKRISADENGVEKNCYTIDFSKLEFWKVYKSVEAGIDAAKNSCLLWSAVQIAESFLVVLNLDPDEITRPDRKPSAQAVVHSSNEEKDPFEHGFTMEEGKRYTVTIKAFEEHLLPDPYSTNCVEDEALEGDYDREKCIGQCIVRYFVEKCKCLPQWLKIDESIIPCDVAEATLCLSRMNDENCYEKCPRRCHYFYLEYKVSSSKIESAIKPIDLGDGPIHLDWDGERASMLEARKRLSSKGKTLLRIVYSSKEITVYKYKPKYEKIEILGYIGGFSGIWLGVSLVAVCDFFETMFVFTMFLIRKAKESRRCSRR